MRRILTLGMAALLAFGVAACGGDDSSSSDDTSASTDDGGTADDGGGDSGGTDADIAAGLVDEDCQFLLAGLFANPAATGDEETADQLAAIADKAPEEIQDAMEILANGYAQMTEALQDVDASDPQAYAEAMAGLEDVFDDEYEAASQTVTDYVDENCSGG
jgi:hypothetical protein